jgi:Domain of unknown function (DUF5658)
VSNCFTIRPTRHPNFGLEPQQTVMRFTRAWFLHRVTDHRGDRLKNLDGRAKRGMEPAAGPMTDRRAGRSESAAAMPERRARYDRRRITLRTFFQGGFTPRRRGGRRAGEQHLPIDWHEPHLLFLAVTILLLSVADAFLTLTLMTIGATEANPLLAFILDKHPKLFAGVKMVLTGGGVLVLVAVARTRVFNVLKVSTVMHWLLIGYAGLIFYEWSLLRTHL